MRLPLLQAMSGMVNDADIEYNLGICLSELGRVEECLAPLQRCIELDPDYANAYIGLGVAHARLGNPEAAEAALRSAVRLEPENAYAKRNLAGVLSRNGKSQEALPFFRQAASIAPKDPGCLLGLAQCLEELGGEHLKEAGTVYEKILRQFPDDPVGDIARKARNRLSNDNAAQDCGWPCPHGRGDVHAGRDAGLRRNCRGKRSGRSSSRSQRSASRACRSMMLRLATT